LPRRADTYLNGAEVCGGLPSGRNQPVPGIGSPGTGSVPPSAPMASSYVACVADDITNYHAVEGYFGRLSYRPGDTLTLHTTCSTPTFHVSITRSGATRNVVWTGTVEGAAHPTPADADANGCGWPASLTLPVSDAWPSGFYVATLRAVEAADDDRAASEAAFVVRAQPAARKTTLLVVATNTYNAYNNWGGRSLYTGGTQVSFQRPFGRGMLSRIEAGGADRKSPPTRWDADPDVDGDEYQRFRWAHGYPGYMGSAGWHTYERRFVEWAESHDLHFDYAVSRDLDDDPTVLDGYSLVLSVGHDEYWSAGQRDALERHIAGGGNVVSMSGNTMFWQVRLEADAMVCHKYTAHLNDPVMAAGAPESGRTTMTGMWADPVVGRPETAVLGAGSAWGLYNRFGAAMPRGSGGFTVYRHDHWLFDGTGLRYGDVLGAACGVVGYETVGCRLTFDEYQLPIAAGGDGTPEEIEVVAFTPSTNLAMGEYPKSIAALDDQGDLEFVAERLFGRLDDDSLARCRYGNAVIVVCRPFAGGGQVVTIGSTDWVFGLASDPRVAQVTRNAIHRFAAP
jgi:hypothetical protein